MNFLPVLIFIGSAILEVSGDALMRKGLRTPSLLFMVAGFLLLGSYGVLVNMVKWDFSKMLGVYVGVFALVSILTGFFFFREKVPSATWIGLCIIIAGGLVIQFGRR